MEYRKKLAEHLKQIRATTAGQERIRLTKIAQEHGRKVLKKI